MNILLASSITNTHTVDSLRIEHLQQTVDALHQLIDTTNGVICNEISASNNHLTSITIVIAIISLILAVIGSAIGFYISYLYKKVKKAEKMIAEKEQIITSLSQTVQETDEKITNDLASIYKKLRREELKANIQRLLIEPLDIQHFMPNLLGNDLEDDLFETLFQAYQKLISTGKADQGASIFQYSYKENYLLVFFQHFLFQSLLNGGLREDMIKYLKEGCKCAFERDMLKCTKDLCKALNEPIMSKPVDVMYEYLVAVNQSEFKSLTAIKDIIYSDLKDKSILRQAIDRCTADKVYLELFDNKEPIDDEQ